MSNKILVTGATGNTGSGLVEALKEKGADVRTFVRDESKAQSLKEMGTEVVVGDLDNPETLEAAVKGVDKIALITWNGPTAFQQALNVIEAARQADSPHIVRHSGWGPEKSRIITQHQQVEEALQSSGLPWTILKPTFFMQNTMMGAQTIGSEGMLYMPMKDGRIGMIDIRDIVDAAVEALTGSGHEGKTYILTGPASISFHDIADTFSKVLGKEVKYIPVPYEAGRESMVGMGVPEWIADGFAELFEGFSENWADQVKDSVQVLTGHPGRSFEQFARDFKQMFSN